MELDPQKKRKRTRRSETEYAVTVPNGVPTDTVEKISQAHAKAESLIRTRLGVTTKKERTSGTE